MSMVEENTIDKSRNIHTWGEFSEIIKGNGVQKVDFVDEGYGCIHYGQIYTHYGPYTYNTNKFVSKEIFDKAKKASKGDIIMTDTSENVEDICKSVAYLGNDDIAVSNHALIIKHNQNPKFLSYSTLTDSFFNQKRKVVVGVKVSGIKPEQLAKIKIYLPSLSEQQRIVDILDTFTSSIDNLKQQISQRRKQYEYYRDQLLDLEGKEGVEMKSLGEIAKYRRGSFPQPYDNREWYDGEGAMPFVQVADVEEYGRKLKEQTKQQISTLAMPKSVYAPIGTVIVTLQGSIGKVAITQYDSYIDRTLGIFEGYLIKINKVYFALQLEKIFSIKKEKARGGTIKTITKEEFTNFTIPVPPLSEQQRIVDILDKFEASIQNLEAQLSQREKQYEYYRNKLLTFE